MEIEREYYVHDAGCPAVNFVQPDPNPRGLKHCIDCAGIFDVTTGKGVATTDKRFDAEYDIHRAQIEADEKRIDNV